MKKILKRIIKNLPGPLLYFIYYAIESTRRLKVYFKIGFKNNSNIKKRPGAFRSKKNILFYHVSGLSSGGTEKFLQIIAKYLDKSKYNVFFMYSTKPRASSGNILLNGRKSYLENTGVKFIEFEYESMDSTHPYILHKMNPTVFNVLNDYEIDLFITAGPGYTEFPFITISNIPIILINVFGSMICSKKYF